ncbi:MAG TPA: hypothetical protein VGD22_16790, partial [Sphingobacteriaceae bacterium]
MSAKDHSRREFLKRNSLKGLGALLTITLAPPLVKNLMAFDVGSSVLQDKEPVIDIHQHTNYS